MVKGIQAIVLAAGLSRRSKKYKLTLKIDNKTIIEKCIEGLKDYCFEIVVVGGHNFNIISDILRPYSKVKMVYNSNYMEGMFSSVQEGLKHINSNRFFILPGDYPLIQSSTYSRMLTIDANIVIPTYKGRKGHPILITGGLKEDILNNIKYKSLRDFVNYHESSKIEVGDPGILIDIDTMEDYRNILEKNTVRLI